MVIVKADDVDGPALEEVVVGRRLVTACRNGACLIVALHDLRQMTGEQGVDAELAFLGECRGIMTCIENQVSLFKGQRIGLYIAPLFEHLVTNRPHEDARVVTVTKNQIGEVSLVPLIEEAGIVVLGLLASPHVERFVHDYQSHGVTHIQQLRGRRIVRTTDRVHTHSLEFHEFTMKGILVKGSAETTEVMVLTYSVELEVLTIEPEAGLGVELKVAEASGSLYFIHHLAASNQLRAYLIYIWVLTRPLAGLLNACGFAIGIKPSILDYDFLVGGILKIHFHFAIMYIDAPVFDVNGVGLCEPDMAIDATTRVPT